jgi:vacuolar protein sorting-associated protein 13A/C
MDRLLCEITVKDNVKIITLRSTYKVENLTAYPMELVLVDASNKPAYSVQKIGECHWPTRTHISYDICSPVPGGQYALPIQAVTKNRIKLRPDGMSDLLQNFVSLMCTYSRFRFCIFSNESCLGRASQAAQCHCVLPS